MKLAAYLAREGLTHKAFGDAIGVSQAAASRYASGDRFPDRETLSKIHAATKGDVAPNDFVDIAPSQETAA